MLLLSPIPTCSMAVSNLVTIFLAVLASIDAGDAVDVVDTVDAGIPYGSKVDELYSNDGYDNQYENGNGEKEEVAVMGTPEFVSEPKKTMVNEGDTLRLPCIVDRLEGFVLLWKKNSDIITVGSQIINKADTRIKLEEEQNGNYLVISLAEETDAGEYVCQISAYKPTELKHSVEIRVEPVIRLTPESGLLTVKEGDSATLQCDITAGNPTPEIIWRRRERMMPNGEEEIAGSVISFDGVNSHHSGHYICSADNGFGPQPVTAEIKLDVRHSVVDSDSVEPSLALNYWEMKLANQHHMENMRRQFDDYDTNGDGELTAQEFDGTFFKSNMSVAKWDTNGDNVINLREFAGVRTTAEQEELSKKLFKLIDPNGDNVITSDELREMYNKFEFEGDVDRAIERNLKEVDEDKDGLISLQEAVDIGIRDNVNNRINRLETFRRFQDQNGDYIGSTL